MKRRQIRQHAMLLRVRKFCNAHPELFSSAPQVTERLAAIDKAVSQLAEHAALQMSSAREGARLKTLARTELLRRIRSVRQAARLIALKTPAIGDRFRLPDSQTDRAYITAGRVYARHAADLPDAFFDLGQPKTFIADLTTAIARFEQAIGDRSAKQDQYTASQATIAAAIASGLEAARALDVVISNQLKHREPATLEVWRRLRRVGYRQTSGRLRRPRPLA